MLGWSFKSGHQLRLLLGAGYPIFYEQGVPETCDIHFPLEEVYIEQAAG